MKLLAISYLYAILINSSILYPLWATMIKRSKIKEPRAKSQEHRTRNTKRRTRNAEHGTRKRNMEHGTRNTERRTLQTSKPLPSPRSLQLLSGNIHTQVCVLTLQSYQEYRKGTRDR